MVRTLWHVCTNAHSVELNRSCGFTNELFKLNFSWIWLKKKHTEEATQTVGTWWLRLPPANKNWLNIATALSYWPAFLQSHVVLEFDSRHLLEGVGLLYKPWQIVALCQQRVCVRRSQNGWEPTWACKVMKPGACVLSKCLLLQRPLWHHGWNKRCLSLASVCSLVSTFPMTSKVHILEMVVFFFPTLF